MSAVPWLRPVPAQELHGTKPGDGRAAGSRPTGTVSASDAIIALTARQAEVLQLAGRGLSGKQIARQLGISVRTIEDHFSVLRRRTGARNQAELIAYWAAAGLVKPGLAVRKRPFSGRRARRPDQKVRRGPRTCPARACHCTSCRTEYGTVRW
jgi:DNA-binding CsgD family transcriptional regulator